MAKVKSRPAVLGLASLCLAGGCVDTFRATDSSSEHLTKQVFPGQSLELTSTEVAQLLALSPLPPPPRDPSNEVDENPKAIVLGKILFFDKRLSRHGNMACATCHVPSKSYTDGLALGTKAVPLSRHTPSLINVAYNRWFFWDGRADSLWSQALEPIENSREMGGSRVSVASTIANDAALSQLYESVFHTTPAGAKHGDLVQDDVTGTFVKAGKAIAAFESRLLVNDSPFDEFVKDIRANDDIAAKKVLSPSAIRGFKIFVGRGQCITCHSGPNFSDGEFHNTRLAPPNGLYAIDSARLGGVERLLKNPFNLLGGYNKSQYHGLTPYTQPKPEFWGLYKTPSLRNVAGEAPYMHRGQMRSLKEVVQFYSTFRGAARPDHHQEQVLQPLNLNTTEVNDLISFLKSLSGPLPNPQRVALAPRTQS